MRAVVALAHGGPDVLVVRDEPIPEPRQGEVSIDVAYAGINFVEIMQRRGDGGTAVPFVPGYEVSGRIRALGPDVSGLAVGTPVAALTGTGGYAEVATAPAGQVVPLDGPALALGLDVAAALPTVVPTAWITLRHLARVTEGATVLVHAAGGAVGMAAAQVARHLGARTIVGTVGSQAKVDDALAAGCTAVVVRDADWPRGVAELTEGRGFDVVLDSVGGADRRRSLDALGPLGRLVVFGNASGGEDLPLSTHELWFGNRSVMGFNLGDLHRSAPELARAWTAEALQLVADGIVDVAITEVLALDRAAEAHLRVESRRTTGKLLLRVGA